MADQRPVVVQDLFHGKDNRRDLVLGRHMFGGANHQAERSGAGVPKAEKGIAIIWPLRKGLDRLTCQRHQPLDQFQNWPENLGSDDPARNLNLETGNRFIGFDCKNAIQFIGRRFLLKILNHRIGRILPKIASEIGKMA